MNKLIEVEIPFSGFYESIHDSLIDDAINSYFSDDHGDVSDVDQEAIFMADVDWSAIQIEYSKRYIELLAGITELDFQFSGLTSPEYYNFSTDRIFATLPVGQLNKLVKEVKTYDNYASTIKDNFTSYDGFSSNYSNDITNSDWTAKQLDACQYQILISLWLKYNTDTNYLVDEILQEINVYEFDTIADAYNVIQQYKKDNGLEQAPTELELQKANGLTQLTLGGNNG